MKILYVILTCKAHETTRQQWQKDTWLKGVDYVYLDKPVGEETYNNAPLKYIEFFKEYSGDHDWLFFCDDDTFVFTERLSNWLSFQSINYPIMIGFKGGDFNIYNLRIGWCSGGAGIVINNRAIINIINHLDNTPNPIVTHETDISLAIWAHMSCSYLNVFDNKKFSPFNPHDAKEQGMKDCITYHYCTRQDFIDLNTMI